MTSVLLLHAHPRPSQSRHNRPVLHALRELDGVETVDLYALYPRFRIDVQREQDRLVAHSVIVLQCPFYWYSVPALLKEYLDRVLTFGFAYGEGGDRLHGKRLLLVLSAGGSERAYSPTGHNRFPIDTLLTPLQQTAALCGMEWLSPLVLYAAHDDDESRRAAFQERVVETIGALRAAPEHA